MIRKWILAGLTAAFLALSGPASAVLQNYSFSVTITSQPVAGPFLGQTYTGSFVADTVSGLVTDFTADLLGGSYSNANLGSVASFDGLGNVTKLSFVSSVLAVDGVHAFGFTSGFEDFQITREFGLDLNNYFAFLTVVGLTNSFDSTTGSGGGGTPVFTTVGPVDAPVGTPEPASLALLAAGLLGLGALRRRG